MDSQPVDLLAQYGGCNGCGRCCERAGAWLNATPDDVSRWRRAGAMGQKILRHAELLPGGGATLWINPRTGGAINRCPWLEKAATADAAAQHTCAIYALRPEVCRRFPKTFDQAVDFECEPIMVALGMPRQR